MERFISWPWTVRNIVDSGVTRESLCEYLEIEPETLRHIEKKSAVPGSTVQHKLLALSDRITRAKFRGKIKPQLVQSKPRPTQSEPIDNTPRRGVFEVKPLPEGWKGWHMIENGELLVEIRVHHRALNRNVPKGMERWLEEVAPTLRIIHGGAPSSPSETPSPREEV